MSIAIIDLPYDNPQRLRQAAQILTNAFANNWPDAWTTLDDGLAELAEFNTPERIGRCALDELGDVVGWIGGISDYDGHVWELHPLAVRPDQQGKGIGQALVADFIEQVRLRGGITITVGTDDENNMTSLGGVDLYPDPLQHVREIRNMKRHPYEFYQRMGFVIVGIIPDANGFGKPDILLARRVEQD